MRKIFKKKVQPVDAELESVAGEKGERRIGLQGRMMLRLGLSLIIVILVMGMFLVQQTKFEIGTLTDANIKEQVISAKKDSENYFNQFIEALSIVSSMDNVQNMIDDGIKKGEGHRFDKTAIGKAVYKDLENSLGNFPEGAINLFAACEANNQLMRSNGTCTDPEYKCEDDQWYVSLKEKKKPIVTGVYETENTQGLVVTVAVPVMRGNEVVGAVGSDIALDKLRDIIKAMKVGETGYIMVYDKDKKLIFHPSEEKIFERIDESEYTDELKAAVNNHEDHVGIS